jgi:superfamily II DNA/RNA helicase
LPRVVSGNVWLLLGMLRANRPWRLALRSRGVPQSTDALLDRMAGTGRLILTASTASQPAYEDARLGHGLLTYHLLQALLGPEDVAHEGRINLLDLLRYVTQQVKGSASGTVAARQEPTLRGQWDGEVSWPVFTPGARYRLLYPPRSLEPVTEDVRSLQGHGIPELVLDRWAKHLSGLNQLQQDAVNEAGLLEGRNVLVMSPTSSGKTIIGELAAVRATQNGGRSVFLLPTKALVNEQQEEFERLYSPAGVHTIRATGDFSDQVSALMRGQFDIAVLTYEMFSRLALASPHLLRITSVIVIDEVQTVVDPGRGAELEFLLTLVPLVRKLVEAGQQVIVIRAIRGEARGAALYLAGSLGLPAANDALDPLPAGDPSISSAELRRCLQGGTAFHVSDLDRDERRVIEDAFRAPDSTIRVMVATTTLAQGVNMPAETVVIPELRRPAGAGTFQPYRVAEYKNMAGRAGRLGLTEQGRAVVLAYSRADAIQAWSRYVNGTPEGIHSTLLDPGADIYTLVLRVVAEASHLIADRGLLNSQGTASHRTDSCGRLPGAGHHRRGAGHGSGHPPGRRPGPAREPPPSPARTRHPGRARPDSARRSGPDPRELPQSDRRGTKQAGADRRGGRRDRAEVHREQPPAPAGAPGCRPAGRRGRRRSRTRRGAAATGGLAGLQSYGHLPHDRG